MHQDQNQPSQQLKQSLRWFFTTLSIVGSFLLISCASDNIQAPTMSAGDTANAYYQAIENKDYIKAYSYLSSDFPVGAHEALSQKAFIVQSQTNDTSAGPVTSFSQVGSSTSGGTVTITMSITCGRQSYLINLQLQQNNGTWRLVNQDGI
ncbi:MAG TPA: hypothetical protein VNG51_00930 [Ktedonobacteraceae bacterium]|nr:hypothetical protein [Ktedonobacteraceae bacterium]